MYVAGVAILVEMSEIDVAKYVCILARPNSLAFLFTLLFIHVKLPSPILPNVHPVPLFLPIKQLALLEVAVNMLLLHSSYSRTWLDSDSNKGRLIAELLMQKKEWFSYFTEQTPDLVENPAWGEMDNKPTWLLIYRVFFSYASSSTLYPGQWVSQWVSKS